MSDNATKQDQLAERAKKCGLDPITATEDQIIKAEEQIAKQVEMLNFVGIDTCDGNTRFIDIDYSNNGPSKRGRTVIILGTFGIHARMTGEFEGKVWNENLAINQSEERNWDMTMSCRREFVHFVSINKVKPLEEGENVPDHYLN